MIKILNIYYMLAYAFQVLRENSYAAIEAENFTHVEDLLAAILAKGTANLIKRGLGHEYLTHSSILYSPRGKISISDSLKENCLQKKQLVCEYDEYSENTYINQVLKTTAISLLHCDEVDQKQKKALRKVLLYFVNVKTISPNSIRWGSIVYNRSNATSRMLMNICHFALESLLPTMRQGREKLPGFWDDRMPALYEKFVLEYYRKHFPALKPSAAMIAWNIDDGIADQLPNMKSDITLKCNDKILIIDTKYYEHSMQIDSRYKSATIHSENLYQIFAYVKNRDVEHKGNVSGMLLYAKTDEEITPDADYHIDGSQIWVKTLDLDQDFSGIQQQLDGIVEKWLGYTPAKSCQILG